LLRWDRVKLRVPATTRDPPPRKAPERKALPPASTSYAGLTRVSSHLRKKHFSKKMDCHRVKPGEVKPGNDAEGDETSEHTIERRRFPTHDVIRGLDPGIQPSSQEALFEEPLGEQSSVGAERSATTLLVAGRHPAPMPLRRAIGGDAR
jgi:hypothetical protein